VGSDDLKNFLWETMTAVRRKVLDPTSANAIARQAKEMLSVVKAETEAQSARATEFLGKKP
jgi:hypothetical protein